MALFSRIVNSESLNRRVIEVNTTHARMHDVIDTPGS